MATSGQKRAELKRLAKAARDSLYRMLQIVDELLADVEYVDRFKGESQLIDDIEAKEFAHFGGSPSLAAMLRAYRANPKKFTWAKYNFNIAAMIELAAPPPEPKSKNSDPDAMNRIVAEAAAKYPSDINKAVVEAERRIRRDVASDELKKLVRHSIQERIYDWRHDQNERFKAAGEGNGKATEAEVYNYFIGGMVIGNVTGKMLSELAASEQEKANGHALNAAVCRKFAGVVPETKMLKRCVSAAELHEAFQTIEV